MTSINIHITTDNFDLDQEYQKISQSDQDNIGAIVSFVGRVRLSSEQKESLAFLELEHYHGMTEIVLHQLAEQATQRWELNGITIIHRVGKLTPADQIVLVLVASSHRQSAFEACEFLIDCLKTNAPFWKKEILKDGSYRWLDAKATDLNKSAEWLQNQSIYLY